MVVLVSDEIVVDDPWGEYVAELWEQTRDPVGPHRLLPVALSEHAFNLHAEVGAANFIRAASLPTEERNGFIADSVVHELCQLLLNRPRVDGEADPSKAERTPAVNVFLSHASVGGRGLVEGFHQHLVASCPLNAFIDVRTLRPAKISPYGSATESANRRYS
ncbi:hypothetical protein [Stratiformator vulcanicus]|uniref:TIR domain-containing protein n=1 Tax=Stratiformator vulcanicus TaxID=2527980 RepID=A0A517QWG2_9PLAN|nr:hypothetical protein [Stratiformator vulcanicus]QDT35971.1 hypothetical protein Pan189_03260 [Stratiformator vulcanicus]